jgi:hypothetical protein
MAGLALFLLLLSLIVTVCNCQRSVVTCGMFQAQRVCLLTIIIIIIITFMIVVVDIQT